MATDMDVVTAMVMGMAMAIENMGTEEERMLMVMGKKHQNKMKKIGRKNTARKANYIEFKNFVDKIVSIMGLVFLSPVFLGIAMAIKLEEGWSAPVFFMQKRVGIHKTHFMLYKFRSMRVDTPKDVPTHLMRNPEDYLTKIGRWLRKTSLDELPQLLNIIRGDMAIIGPRPALWNQFDLVEEREKYGANDVRPGLTGWAQVNGRDELGIEEKARYDGYYVRNMGVCLDARCLLKTIIVVLTHEGVAEGGRGR